MVHLPFYLQNSGLRKVKIAQQTSQSHRKLNGGAWNDADENINLAGNSLLGRSVSLLNRFENTIEINNFYCSYRVEDYRPKVPSCLVQKN